MWISRSNGGLRCIAWPISVFVSSFIFASTSETQAYEFEYGYVFQLGSGNEDVEELLRVKELLPERVSNGFQRHLDALTAKRSLDFSNRDLRSARIHLVDGKLARVSFDGSNLTGANLTETHFYGCSFRGAKLQRAKFSVGQLHDDCDLEDADIRFCTISLSRSQLESTASFKNRDLSNMELHGDFAGCDFTGCNLSGTLLASPLEGCNLTNADISGASLGRITAEQLITTENYKNRDLHGCRLANCDLRKVDFTGFDLGLFVDCDLTGAILDDACFVPALRGRTSVGFVGCTLSAEQFYTTRNYRSKSFYAMPDTIQLSRMKLDNWQFNDLDLRGLVIHLCSLEGANFSNARGGAFRATKISIDQVKSMWNFKNNRGDKGFVIPDEIREQLK